MKFNPWPYFVGAILVGTLVLNVTVYRAANNNPPASSSANPYEDGLRTDSNIAARHRFHALGPVMMSIEGSTPGGPLTIHIDGRFSGFERGKLLLLKPESSVEDREISLSPLSESRVVGQMPTEVAGVRLIKLSFVLNGEDFLYEGRETFPLQGKQIQLR